MEIVFMGVMASLVGGAVWVLSRRPRAADADGGPSVPIATGVADGGAATAICPACQREFPASMRYCTHDARALVAAHELDAHAGPGVTCRGCDRSFDGSTRYCPFDGDELSPATRSARASRPRRATPALGTGGRICPTCTERYAADEAFCGRDGATLVALN